MDILFQEKNLCPNKEIDVTSAFAYSAVNAVAIVTGLEWTAIVRRLIDQAHERAYMPTDKTVNSDMMRAAGFRTINIHNYGGLDQYIRYCQSQPKHAKYIVQLLHYGFFALVPSPDDPTQYVLQGCKKDRWSFRHIHLTYTHYSSVQSFWVYVPGSDNRTGIDRNGHKLIRRYEDHTGFSAVNLNPKDKGVGDCAVRALAGAYGCSWNEAVDLLAQTNGYTDPIINGNENIIATLIRLGFERHKTIRRNGCMLDGNAFCDLMTHTYCKGERIFAFVGATHAAAVLSSEREGKIRYRIQDSWDSTSRKIHAYWVYDPREAERIRQKKQILQTGAMQVGNCISHPKFGKGTLLTLKDGYGEIDFGQAGVKKISLAWLTKEMEKNRKEV